MYINIGKAYRINDLTCEQKDIIGIYNQEIIKNLLQEIINSLGTSN